MGLLDLPIGIGQMVQGGEMVDALKKKGVDPLSPEYKKMQALAESLSQRGFSQQEIMGIIGAQNAGTAAFNYNAKNASGGNFAQAFSNSRANDVGMANTAFASKDAELKNQNVDRLFNTYQVLQAQKQANLDRYDKQYGAAQNLQQAGLGNISKGATEIAGIGLSAATGGLGGSLLSGVSDGLYGAFSNGGNKGGSAM